MKAWWLALVVACSAHDRVPEKPVPPVLPPVTAPGLRLPDGAEPLAYDVRLEVDPDREDFTGHATVKMRLAAPADHFWIHADELDLARVSSSLGPLTVLPVAGDQMIALSFGRSVPAGELTVDFDYTGHTRHDQEGLFRQQQDGRWYLFSQGQSVFTRRIVPCFDEPRWKTPWKVTLVVPAAAVALANMPERTRTTRPDGRVEIAFAETPPMASYLLAIAVGPFELVDSGTVGVHRIPLRVAALAGQRDRVAVVRAELPAIVDEAERMFDDALPLQKLDLVVVPHFFGAMENPGLITFDEPAIVGDAKRRSFQRHFMRMAAHEIVHQWFGNLVTPAWWDDLWIAESFASWLGDRIAGKLGAIADSDLEFAHQRREALDADAEPDARAIRRTIEHNDDPDNSFDAIAYEKGQVVLAMLEDAQPTLMQSLLAFVRAHRNSSVTAKDLVAALGNPELGAALDDAIDHPGAPVVELALKCTPAPTVEATVRAGRTVPVCLRYGDGHRSVTQACKVVHGTGSFDVALPGCPTWVSGNRDGGYYEAISTLPLPPPDELTARELLALGEDLADAFDRGELHARDAIDAIAKLTASKRVYSLLAAVEIARALDPFFEDTTRPAWSSFLAARFGPHVLRGSSPAELDLRDVLADLVPAAALPPDISRAALRALDPAEPDPALVAFAAPAGGRVLFDRIAKLAQTTRDIDIRRDAVISLGRFGVTELPAALAFVATPALTGEEAWPAVAGYLDRASTRAAAWRTIQPQLSKLVSRMTAGEAPVLIESTETLCDAHSRAEVAAAFEPRLHDIAEGKKHLDHALAAIDRCLTRRTRAGDLAHVVP
jgi:alanyl aminopeptidase